MSHIIKNFREIIGNSENPLDSEAREIALTIIEAAISTVDPRNLVRNKVNLRGSLLEVESLHLNLERYGEIIVVGAGKASGSMAEALEETLKDRISSSLINVQRGTSRTFRTEIVELNEAGHPIPDEGGLAGSNRIMEILSGADEGTLVILLLSGGGSALLPLPQEGITLAEMKAVTNLLLRSGATINEVNAVRKHISGIKGGRLATKTYPATLLCLILSDVVGDPLSTIASGPAVPDPSTYSDAVTVLRKHHIWERAPSSVKEVLVQGLRGERPETPKPGDPRFSKVYNILLGSNRVALEAAECKARELDFNVMVLSSFIEGEARHVGTLFAGIAREMARFNLPIPAPAVLLAGGETTVTVSGSGRGGRNQELVLSASTRLGGLEGIVLASVNTDGLDGPCDAAGAVADGSTLRRAAEMDLNPSIFLEDNDSYHFFEDLGDLVFTGPTGTNVNDVTVLVKIGM
jgi:glycerate 2-kinase